MHKLAFFDLVSDLGRRKQEAARARFSKTARTGEEPRRAYLAACSEMGKALAADGFRFVKSIPALKRDSHGFIHQIWFQSSPNNIRGDYVALWIHVNVGSQALKKWRAAIGCERSGSFVAGGQIGNLEEPKGWSEWNVANPKERRSQIDDAVVAIRRIALPFLKGFADRTTALATATSWPAPGLEIRQLIELCLCFNDLPKAQALLERYFMLRPDLLQPYTQALEEYARTAPPDHWDAGSARDMAKLTVLHGLHPVSAA